MALAVVAAFTAMTLASIWNAVTHTGPGVAHRGYDGETAVVVPAAEYKRERLTGLGLTLFVELCILAPLIASLRRKSDR